MKNPKVGDKIEHTCSLNGKFEGKVIQILAMQFIYKTKDGQERFCLFKESWNYKSK
tara:strand:+ start:1637 stop:1804 length:168 start_codon:yes stop_codon:yes gene_type:complete